MHMIRYPSAKEIMTKGDETMIFFGRCLDGLPTSITAGSTDVMNQPSHVVQLLDVVISEAARVALIMLHPLSARCGIGIIEGLEIFLRV